MERPKIEQYKYAKDHTSYPDKYVDDKYVVNLNIYIDQLEAENKALSESLKAIHDSTIKPDTPFISAIHKIASKALNL